MSTRALRLTLAGTWLGLGLLHICGILFASRAEYAWLFDLDTERNVPTYYNALLWALTAIIIGLLALQANTFASRGRWSLLAVLFAYFAIDESFVLHERLAAPVRNFLNINDGSPFYHAWIVLALFAVLFLFFVYLFIGSKDKISREQRVIYGLLLILAVGVISLEAIGTQIYVSPKAYKLAPVLVEELFEIGMVSLLLYKSYGYVLIGIRDSKKRPK